MTQQILAIVWAQFRITRNHLPRTGVAAVLMWLVTSLWNAMFLVLAVLAAIYIPQLSLETLRQYLPVGLLGLFFYNQTIPLFTLSTGWSLQLNKLQVYPIRDISLFGLEVLLRVTTTPESIILIVGAVIGLARRPDITTVAALCLLLFVPFNLFIQLAIREFIVHAFERNRFREIITIFFISIGVIPQLLLRTGLGFKLKPYFLSFAYGDVTPWHASAALSLGSVSFRNFLLLTAWTLAAFALARKQFANGLQQDDTFRGTATAIASRKQVSSPVLDSIGNLFHDPVSALVQKELRSLVRMPRFRVMLGMACIFSAVLFLPMIVGHRDGGEVFRQNYFPFANLYGLLILADILLLNIFGIDRAAAQLYFLSPAPLAQVIKAKNIVAALFIVLQNLLVAMITPFFSHVSLANLAAGFLASAVATVHLMWAGNLLSVYLPRPVDPASTLRRQSNAKVQLWILLCTLGMAVLIGFGYLASYAFHSHWALLGVLLLELGIGIVTYYVALDVVVKRAMSERERIISELSKTSAVIGGASA